MRLVRWEVLEELRRGNIEHKKNRFCRKGNKTMEEERMRKICSQVLESLRFIEDEPYLLSAVLVNLSISTLLTLEERGISSDNIKQALSSLITLEEGLFIMHTFKKERAVC